MDRDLSAYELASSLDDLTHLEDVSLAMDDINHSVSIADVTLSNETPLPQRKRPSRNNSMSDSPLLETSVASIDLA